MYFGYFGIAYLDKAEGRRQKAEGNIGSKGEGFFLTLLSGHDITHNHHI
ncbi:MAG: hypothetical protein F6K54_32535 [Okeania sp. SIO3B5]|nr:hypothetical protein [Okeania sp. SIO3B5]NEO57389.1 hypothetical protein [Okeania sp. SIO3B5]